MSRNRRRAFGRLALAVALHAAGWSACAAWAAPPGPPAPSPSATPLPVPLQRLARDLARRGAQRVAFVERRYSSLTREPLESRGTLAFMPPDRLQRTTTAPRPETLTIQGDLLTIDSGDARPRTVRIDAYPALVGLVQSLRATLAGDLAGLQQHFSLAMQGGPQGWTLTLLPFDAALAQSVERIVLQGRAGEVERVEVFEPGGDRTELRLGAGG